MKADKLRRRGNRCATCVPHTKRRNVGEVVLIHRSFLAVLLMVLAFAGCARPLAPGVGRCADLGQL